MKRNRFKASLLLGVFLLHLVATTSGGAAGSTSSKTIEVYQKKSATESRDHLLHLATTRRLDVDEAFYLGVAYFANQQLSESLLMGYQALGMTTDPKVKGAIYVLISQSLGALEKFEEAAQAALAGQRFDPDSKQLAGLRIAYFDQVNNQSQKQAAWDHLRSLDANFDRKPVMVAVSGAMIIAAIAIAVTAAKLLNDNWEHFNKLVMNIVETFVEARTKLGAANTIETAKPATL